MPSANPAWSDVNAWRKEQRDRLRAARLALRPAERRALRERILGHVTAGLPELPAATVGFYWPMRGEVDVLPLMRAHVAAGGRAALPVVVRRNAPVEWWAWTPDTPMTPGVWNIPVPAERVPAWPSVLVVPLLGFDPAGYRLGNGGGYYDRTLAALVPPPLTLGVGYGLGRLESIRPQAHDLPLDVCITEDGWHWPAPLDGAGRVSAPDSSSPVCYAAEADPGYFGYLDEGEAAALLAELRQEAAILLTLASALADHEAAHTPVACGCARLSGLLLRAGAPAPPVPSPRPLPAGAVGETARTLAARLQALGELAEAGRARIADERTHALLAELCRSVQDTLAHLADPAAGTR